MYIYENILFNIVVYEHDKVMVAKIIILNLTNFVFRANFCKSCYSHIQHTFFNCVAGLQWTAQPYTYTLSLFMKKIPWWSLLLEVGHHSLARLTQC